MFYISSGIFALRAASRLLGQIVGQNLILIAGTLNNKLKSKNRLMKQPTKWFVTALAVASGLMIGNSAQAQAVTGTPYLSNMDPSTLNTAPNALYGSWNGGATFTSLSTGLEVNSATYGSMYYVIPAGNVQTLNTADTIATLTFTVNDFSLAKYGWIGTPFILNDNSGAVTLGGYSGPGNPGSDPGTTWNGNVVTETENLSAGQIAAIQLGNDAIYSFNFEVDPAGVGPPTYDITFNSLVLSSVPEPSTLALFAFGVAGLFIARRRVRAV